MITALTQDEQTDALSTLLDWTHDPERRALFRHIAFRDFSEAFGVMTRIALEAEKVDHHPEWSNVYNRIDIWLTTHDANGVSARDIDMARKIDRIAASVR